MPSFLTTTSWEWDGQEKASLSTRDQLHQGPQKPRRDEGSPISHFILKYSSRWHYHCVSVPLVPHTLPCPPSICFSRAAPHQDLAKEGCSSRQVSVGTVPGPGKVINVSSHEGHTRTTWRNTGIRKQVKR